MNDSMLTRMISFSLEKRLIVFLLFALLIGAGIAAAPFGWKPFGLDTSSVAVDAIPDIGENQQIVFTDWPGRSPRDVEDQITYPLTTSLMGIPGVKTIRSYSYFGFSSVYVIFKEDVEFYWSRSRIMEKLNSLPPGTVPDGVSPALGPDATALGQVYWYTLEGRDPQGNPAGGWSLEELRSINDFQIRYALQSVEGVAEAASAGGMVREYQVDADPDKLRHYGISLQKLYAALAASNRDVGARTMEINRVEYIVRGRGYLENISDIRNTVVAQHEGTPLFVKDLAVVQEGPAPRRGALDKGGVDAAGGVVTARYGENPMKVLKGIEKKVNDIAPGLPAKTLEDGTESRVSIIPFYNRSGLIAETLNTLRQALTEEILITIIVIVFMLGHIRSSLIISLVLPASVLSTFLIMKLFGVDANVVALSGIAIAIGTMVDMGIIISENIVIHLENAPPSRSKLQIVRESVSEVASAVVTAVFTTVISFIPVFTMTAAEGKLFKPLAFTKTFAIVSALLFSLFLIPPLATLLFERGRKSLSRPKHFLKRNPISRGFLIAATLILALYWKPLGEGAHGAAQVLFTAVLLFSVLFLLQGFIRIYPAVLRITLRYKAAFLMIPLSLCAAAVLIWRSTGSEFMPTLDEGSFLLMPTTMPHTGFEEAQEQLSLMDRLLESIPEVESAVGKLGRADTPLDPAPVSMYEVIINYKDEYGRDSAGNRVRQWRDSIKSPDDIWNEIVRTVQMPGVTSAPKLMPIAARIVMLQSGMRAPMGIRITGQDLTSIEDFGIRLEQILKKVPAISPATVNADRIVGKPYIEYSVDRRAAATHGISVDAVHQAISTAVGGKRATRTVEGRERYAVRLRYLRSQRDNLDEIGAIRLQGSDNREITLADIADINYTEGPMVIKSEEGFPVGYVTFGGEENFSETEVVENAIAHLDSLKTAGDLAVPSGITYEFTGNYKNQLRARRTLSVVIPLALVVIFIILYLQFSRVSTAMIIFSGIIVAWAGGFILIGLYNTDWFLNISLFGIDFRQLFQIRTVNLSVAVWVGFLALFGIASDNGVVISEYLRQNFKKNHPKSREEVRRLVVEAAQRRIRPCMMTTGTTLLALVPVLTSDGRGSDIMLPMSIPAFGGMAVVIISVFIVPVLYSLREEMRLNHDADGES
ncbi:MAG: efflux RND transporter permease subunit [Fibrobacterota bacterium]